MNDHKVMLTPSDEITVTINGVVVGTYRDSVILEVKGDTKKVVDANISLTIIGNVAGDVDGTNITCGDVGGTVNGTEISCGYVTGGVDGTNITCGNVGGNVDGTNITCGNVAGDVDGLNITHR